MSHHHASFQVLADGTDRCRIVWIADLLPALPGRARGHFMEQGAAVIARTLEESIERV